MSAQIVNGAPMTILQGTQDKSTKQLTQSPSNVPTHCPKIFFYAQKGDTNPHLVSGDSLQLMYGSDSFDLRKPWANHATVFANEINAAGNAIMAQRVIPTDAGPLANLLLSLDVLPTQVPVYQRNADGSLKVDVAGNPLPQMTTGATPTAVTTAGFICKWVVSSISTTTGFQAFGAAAQTPGDQTDVGSGTQSTRYPIFQFAASSVGSYGNNCGVTIYSPNALTGGFNSSVMSGANAYPVLVSFTNRANATNTAQIVTSQTGAPVTTVALKPGAINTNTDAALYIGDILLDKYRNLTNTTYPIVLGDFGQLKVYQSNIDLLINEFYAAEQAYMVANPGPASVGSDFSGAAGEQYLFNLLGGTTSSGAPYTTVKYTAGINGYKLNQYTNFFASGSSDGTMNDTNFAALVATEMAKYADPTSSLLDTARNVESIFYDSGFPLQTKYALTNFIAIRKDTCVVLSTAVAGAVALTEDEEQSVSIALRSHLQAFPESDYFGTPVMRGLVMGRSGIIIDSQYTGRMPLTLEIAKKAAAYMGASNGKWKNGYNFDGYPGHIVTSFRDINITFTPATVRNQDWANGLNWVQSYDTNSNFIPALKTVYSDDTSVLNSFITVLAICEINKVQDRAWRYFSGVSGLSQGQLIDKVNAFITKNTQGRFDNRFVIVPDTYFSADDSERGYSWTSNVKIYAPNMETVMTTMVQAFRLSDYVATSA
jgi:hypothetical protein